MADPAWRQRLRPASFRSVKLHVDIGRSVGGRRGVNLRVPRAATTPRTRTSAAARAGALSPATYYIAQADALEAALSAGVGNLSLPTQRSKRMRCETYDRTACGWAVFDCVFVEAPASSGSLNAPAENMQAAVRSAADAAADAIEPSAGSDADWV